MEEKMKKKQKIMPVTEIIFSSENLEDISITRETLDLILKNIPEVESKPHDLEGVKPGPIKGMGRTMHLHYDSKLDKWTYWISDKDSEGFRNRLYPFQYELE